MNTNILEKLIQDHTLDTSAVVSKIVESECPVKPGDSVAITGDSTYDVPGTTGKVKGPSSKGSGWYDVQLPNGTIIPLQSDLLIPI